MTDRTTIPTDPGLLVPASEGNLLEVLYDYQANERDELSIKQREILVVVERNNTEWWRARRGQNIGYVPANYLRPPSAGVYAEVTTGANKVQEGDIVEVLHTVYANSWTVRVKGEEQVVSSDCIRILEETKGKKKAAPTLPKSSTTVYERMASLTDDYIDQVGATEMESVYECLDYDLPSHIYEPMPDFDCAPNRELRLVMVGKTGAGKSSTANSILQADHFLARACGQSVTTECQRGDGKIYEHRMSVVDTPGLFDTKLSKDKIRENIIRCIHTSYPGPHLFLIVVQIGRFTNEEILALENLFEIFGNSMEFYSILVFTRYDDLQRDGTSIEQYIEESGEPLQTYVKKCSNRYFALNNVEKGPQKLAMMNRFMELITEVAKENKWKPYSHEMIQEAQKNVQPLIKSFREEKDSVNNQVIKEIESHYAVMKEDLKKKRTELLAKIRTCTEERDRLIDSKRRALAILLQKNVNLGSAKSTEDMEELQREINEEEEKLRETYKELEEHGNKQKELETEYLQINIRRKDRVLSTKKKQHDKMISELRNFTDEHFNKIDIMIADICLIDQQLGGVNKELDTVSSRADKKRLTARRSELMKERAKATNENAQYLEQMLNKSNDLRNQLARKEKFCRIM